MSVTGHIYRATWYDGQRCHCHNLTDADIALRDLAAERVASGGSSTIESATWSITYQSGYCHGRSDGQSGTSRDITGASDGYAAGYRRGYQWGQSHPLHAFTITH